MTTDTPSLLSPARLAEIRAVLGLKWIIIGRGTVAALLSHADTLAPENAELRARLAATLPPA